MWGLSGALKPLWCSGKLTQCFLFPVAIRQLLITPPIRLNKYDFLGKTSHNPDLQKHTLFLCFSFSQCKWRMKQDKSIPEITLWKVRMLEAYSILYSLPGKKFQVLHPQLNKVMLASVSHLPFSVFLSILPGLQFVPASSVLWMRSEEIPKQAL